MFAAISCFLLAFELSAQTTWQFPEDAVKAWNQLDQKLTSDGWDMTFHEVDEKRDRDTTITDKCQNGMHLRHLVYHKSQHKKSGSEHVVAYNDEYGFRLGRINVDSQWVIEKLHRNDPENSNPPPLYEPLNSWKPEPNLDNLFYFSDPWPITLREIIVDKGFHVRSVKDDSQFGKQQVVVEFYTDGSGGNFPSFENCKITFDPDRSWMPLSWRFQGVSGHAIVGKNSDIRRCDGIHVAFQQEWSYLQPNGQLKRTRSKTFESFQLGSCDRFDFSLSAFGVPEISDRYRERFPWLRYTLIGVGVIALVFAFRIMRKN